MNSGRMMKSTLGLVTAFTLCGGVARADSWSLDGTLPAGVAYHGVAAVDGGIFVFGGYSSSSYVYHPGGGYSMKADLPQERHTMGYAEHGGRVYSIAGYHEGAGVWGRTVNVWSLDPSANPPEQQWTVHTSLTFERAQNGATSLGDYIYTVGGHHEYTGRGVQLTHVERYNPDAGGPWVATAPAPLNHARLGLGVVTVGGKIYAIGGARGGVGVLDVMEIYDPVTDQWTEGPPMPTARNQSAITVLGDRIYVIGGSPGSGFTNAVEYYDVNAGQWYADEPFPVAASGLRAATSGGHIYVLGGQSSSGRLDTVYVLSAGGPTMGTIGGTIKFLDPSGAALDKADIPDRVEVRVFDQNSAWQGPSRLATPAYFYPKRHTEIPFDVTDNYIEGGTVYDVGVSVAGHDLKVLPIAGGATDAEIVVTFHDLRKPFWRRPRGSEARQTEYTYFFFPGAPPDNFEPDEVQAIVDGMQLWTDALGITFVLHDPGSLYPADITFRWGEAGTAETTRYLPYVITFDNVSPRNNWTIDKRIHWAPWGNDWWHTPSGDIPLTYVSAHEIGHVLGLRDIGGVLDSGRPPGQYTIMTTIGYTGWLGYSDFASVYRIKTAKWWTAETDCPVDLVVTDPLGRTVSKTQSAIPSATYVEEDRDGDGDPDDQVRVRQPISGTYMIDIVPEPGADPNDTVTLIVEDHAERSILLDEVRVADLPTGPIQMNVDRTTPDLTVGVTPGELDGCGGGMETILVDITVDDNQDPAPQVALAGIVVNGEYDPADIQGADEGTDDREFQLRATLNPDGSERVYTIYYAAVDASGNVSEATATVNATDFTPPTVTCMVATDVLWSPDHRLVDVGLTVTVEDDCDGSVPAEPVEIQVYADESEVPETGDGTGRHAPDAKLLPQPLTLPVESLRLRNERRGREDGRVYLIVAKAVDSSGNVGLGYCTVVVPHDQSQAGLDLVSYEADAAVGLLDGQATTIEDMVSPLGYVKHAVSEPLGPHQ